MRLVCDGYSFADDGAFLVISKEGREVMRLPALPRAGDEEFQPGPWEEKGSDHFAMDAAGLGSVHLAIREGRVCYWVETERKHFPVLSYFPDSSPTDTGWHTFLSDEMDRYWSVDENADVPISSAYKDMHPDMQDGAGMTDPGDKPPTWIWNVPARAFAIETPEGWLGVSLPGPLSVGITRLTMNRGLFNLDFEELRPTAAEWGPPRVYFLPGLADPYDTLDQHRAISRACGLMTEKAPEHLEWWGYPTYKAGDELFRIQEGRWILHDDRGNLTSYFTTDNWLRWIEHVEKYTGLKGRMNVQVDQFYFYGYGARHVVSTLGGADGFRRTIDELRDRGIRTSLYLHLYLIDPGASDFPSTHPEAICRRRDSSVVLQSGVPLGGSSLEYIDWTHPAGRQYMLDYIEWLLSDKPGCLNADCLFMNNNLGVDPRKWEFHDPDWGTGDLMTMKATKMAYEHAKRIKPDCYVRRQSPCDSYMQPYFDQANHCEEWNGQTTAWYRRLHISTRVMDNIIFHTDAWFVTLTKLTEYYFSLAAICPPEDESVEHAIHPYIEWREMREKDYRRIRAGMQTYMNAPVRKSDECRVNYDRYSDRLEIWRKRTSGALAGWYVAIALHKRAFVTYSEQEARVAASQERRALVPLPPGARLESVEAVPHEGEASPYPFEFVEGEHAVRLWVPDSAGEVMYVRIGYELG